MTSSALRASAHHHWRLRQAARILRGGGVIVCPTEGVYGLGCRFDDPGAANRIMKLKHRGISKGLIVLVNSLSQLGKMLNLDGLDPVVLGEHGSRPVTWLIPATRRAPLWLTGGRREMAVRVCSLPLVNALIDRVGPLISTSANPSGRPAPRSLLQARGYFRAGVDYFLPGKLGRAGGPSEIRDARSGRILRKGR